MYGDTVILHIYFTVSCYAMVVDFNDMLWDLKTML